MLFWLHPSHLHTIAFFPQSFLFCVRTTGFLLGVKSLQTFKYYAFHSQMSGINYKICLSTPFISIQLSLCHHQEKIIHQGIELFL